MGRGLRMARRAGVALFEESPETSEHQVPGENRSLAEEREHVFRIARSTYRAQLIPWKVLGAGVVAGLVVNNAHWSPWGAFAWTFIIAIASFLFTLWRLGGRHVGSGRIDWGNPKGRKQRRIRQRAARSACMGVCFGLWLVAVTLTDPNHAGGELVWLAGAAVWASFSYHGWWQPAETAWQSAGLPTHRQQPDDEDDDDLLAAPPAAPAATRRPREGVPVARGPVGVAQTTARAAAAEAGAQVTLPDTSALLKKFIDVGTSVAAYEDLTAALQQMLEDHKLRAKVVEAVRAPSVTRYGIRPEPGQQVGAILARKKDFALVCGTEKINVLAPIEGRPLVGVEVPNADREWVTVGEVLESREMQRDPHPLLAALGKGPDGKYVTANLQKMPHVLIGGATDGGKSGCLNSLLMSLLTRATPGEVRLLLVDPKRVELTRYEGVPHLLMPVVTKPEVAVSALEWVVQEMDKRYDEMRRAGVRHIDQLNEKIIDGSHTAPRGVGYVLRPYPYWLVVIDELADLMMISEEELEDFIVRIGQLARACGIHLVLATQRPAVEVVTGKIKANVPSRIAFATANHHDSRTILDEVGAEKLLGKGDAIIKLAGMSVSVRIQGCWTSDEEVAAVVDYWRNEAAAKGLTVPNIKLSAVARNTTDPATRVTAYDSVLAAARRLADPVTRMVTKDQIRIATKGLSEAARNGALTRLFDDGLLDKVNGQQAVYAVPEPTTAEEPLKKKDEDPK
jgi:hypothetical protein